MGNGDSRGRLHGDWRDGRESGDIRKRVAEILKTKRCEALEAVLAGPAEQDIDADGDEEIISAEAAEDVVLLVARELIRRRGAFEDGETSPAEGDVERRCARAGDELAAAV